MVRPVGGSSLRELALLELAVSKLAFSKLAVSKLALRARVSQGLPLPILRAFRIFPTLLLRPRQALGCS
jgi:hypothetical protein